MGSLPLPASTLSLAGFEFGLHTLVALGFHPRRELLAQPYFNFLGVALAREIGHLQGIILHVEEFHRRSMMIGACTSRFAVASPDFALAIIDWNMGDLVQALVNLLS